MTKNPELQGSARGSPGQDQIECREIPISEIHVEGEGADLNQEGKAIDRLVSSIRNDGVLAPILVMQMGTSYQLVFGERRLRACQRLGLQSIPARIIDSESTRSKVLEYRMTENLHRSEMNPIREAKCYYEYLQSRIDFKDVSEAIRELIKCGRGKRSSSRTSAETVSTLEEVSGKTSRSIQNYLSLLLLPGEIQKAIIEEKISMSKGYIFAQNIYHPKLLPIFQLSLQKPMSNRALIECFDDANRSEAQRRAHNIGQLHGLLDVAKRIMKKCMHEISRDEADKLLSTLQGLFHDLEKTMGKDSAVIRMPGSEEVAERNVN